MAWKVLQYKLTSACDLLMHNGQTADPTNKWAKLLKGISGKRNKTDADYEEMARIEFFAGLYMSADGPVIPSYMVDAVLVAGAKKNKEGMQAKSAVFCTDHAPLQFDGPRTVDELWADERFRFSAICRVGTARIARMRPKFDEWSAVVSVKYEPTLVNASRIDEWFNVAGSQIGLGDWRPQHGRFDVERLS